MPFRRPLCALALLLGAGRLACSQWTFYNSSGQITFAGQAPNSQPNPNAKRYTITGTVFNSVTDEPIRRALVRLNGPEQRVAFTGGDGRFEIPNVPEGVVWLVAERPGFFDPRSTPDAAPSSFRPQTVGSGNNDFRLYLVPESKIVGAVLDSDGEPLDGINVQVMRLQVVQGRKQWTQQGGAQTDENGVFSIDGQMPGAYIVCTAGKQLEPFNRTNAEAYPGRCYPNSPDPESAQIVDLQSGQSGRVDFTLEVARLYSISGTVTGGCGGALYGLIQAAGMSLTNQFVRVDPATARFAAHSVTNGVWNLTFDCNVQGKMVHTTQEVTVNGADVTGLQVALQPPIEIPVEVVVPQTAVLASGTPGINADSPRLQQLRLIPVDNKRNGDQYYSQPNQNPNGEANAQPSLAVQNVMPGSYTVVASASPGCIGSITYGGADVSREALTITPGAGAQPIVVNLRNDCATLNVNVQADRKDEQISLLIISDQPFIEPQQVVIPGSTSYTASSLTPGSYRVYALSNIAGLAYADPQAMRDIPSQSVTLDANARSDVTVQLVERGKP